MGKFIAEILTQSVALQDTLSYYLNGQGKETSAFFVKKAVISKQIIMTGMGSSNFIAKAFASLNNQVLDKIPTFSINASELLHYQINILQEDCLLVCISQSGESYEIIEILKKIPKNISTAGIVNESESTLAKLADIPLLIKAGREEMTSTKTFVSTLLASYILSWSMAEYWNEIRVKDINVLISYFDIDLKYNIEEVQKMIHFLGDLPALTIIARGTTMATAQQTALMFKEAIKVPAFSMLGGEFRHGPMEMVQEGFKAVLFAPQGTTYQQSIKMAEDIVKFGGKVLLITNSNYQNTHQNIWVKNIPIKDESLFGIASILPMQLFVDQYAKNNGFFAGNFTHGAKVTTIE